LKEKHTLSIALILFGLLIYYFFFEYQSVSKENVEQAGPSIFALNPRQVKKIEIKGLLNGDEFIGEWKGRWILIKGNNIHNSETTIRDFVLYLLTAVEIDKFPVENSLLKNYGLEKPSYQITLTDVTEKTYRFLIGGSNPNKTCVYVKFAESPNVIVAGALLTHELSLILPLLAPA
jgi:hypothetical protein